jgi:hypothetical protein
VSKVLFIPVSVAGGIAAGFVARKLFERVWSLIDAEEPPDPKNRETTWMKLFAADALEGAIFRVVRGIFDHGARRGFARLTGSWPGEQHREPAPD